MNKETRCYNLIAIEKGLIFLQLFHEIPVSSQLFPLVCTLSPQIITEGSFLLLLTKLQHLPTLYTPAFLSLQHNTSSNILFPFEIVKPKVVQQINETVSFCNNKRIVQSWTTSLETIMALLVCCSSSNTVWNPKWQSYSTAIPGETSNAKVQKLM